MYEVWVFESQGQHEPSKFMKVAVPPELYGLNDVQVWARQMEAEYAKEGILIRTVVRGGRSY